MLHEFPGFEKNAFPDPVACFFKNIQPCIP